LKHISCITFRQKAYLFSLLDKIDLIECGFHPETFESGSKENEFAESELREIWSEDATREEMDKTSMSSTSFEVLDDEERKTSSNDGTWEVVGETSNATRSFVVLDESNAGSTGANSEATSGYNFSWCSMNRC
jgi:hypothetical protein